MTNVQPGRLREAREFLGLTREDVASATGWPLALIAELEGGSTVITGEQLRKLSRLYRRPVVWLCGETTFQPAQEFLRQLEHLTGHDREAVLDFAEFLEGAGPAPQPLRSKGEQ